MNTIFIHNNFLVIERNGEEIYRAVAALMNFKHTDGKIYLIPLNQDRFEDSDDTFQDESEVAYTASEIVEWLSDNVGFNGVGSDPSESVDEAYLGEELAGAFTDIPNADISDFVIGGGTPDVEITPNGLLKFTPNAQFNYVKIANVNIDYTKAYLMDVDIFMDRSSYFSFNVGIGDRNIRFSDLTAKTIFQDITSGTDISLYASSGSNLNTIYIKRISIREIIG